MTLDTPGNTVEVDETGAVDFSVESTTDQVDQVEDSLPTPQEVDDAVTEQVGSTDDQGTDGQDDAAPADAASEEGEDVVPPTG